MPSSSETVTQNNLHITCNIWLEETRQIAVSLGNRDHVDDPVQMCIEKAAAAFRFVIEVPDPLQSPTEGPSQSRSSVSILTTILYCCYTDVLSYFTSLFYYAVILGCCKSVMDLVLLAIFGYHTSLSN